MLFRSPSSLPILALAVLAMSAARAQDADPKLASRKQLVACLDSQDAIEQRTAALSRAAEERQAQAQRLQAEDERLGAQVRRQPPKTAQELASYNRAIEVRNAAVKAFNERGRDLERAQENLNATIFRFNEQCGSLLVTADLRVDADEERRRRSGKP